MFLVHVVIILNVSAPYYNGLDTHYDTKMKNRRVPKQGNYRTDTAFIGQLQYAIFKFLKHDLYKKESMWASCT